LRLQRAAARQHAGAADVGTGAPDGMSTSTKRMSPGATLIDDGLTASPCPQAAD
jgi:hypothetical protein